MSSHTKKSRKRKAQGRKMGPRRRVRGPKSLCPRGRRAFLKSMRNSAGEGIKSSQRTAKAFSKGRKACK